MRRLVLYSGCVAAFALAAWLVTGTLAPNAAPHPEAQSLAALPEAPPAPGIEPGVAAGPPPPTASALPQAKRRTAPREPEASAEASEPVRVSAAPEPLSEDDPVRQLLDATWPDETEAGSHERAAIHGAAPQRDRFTETLAPTPPPTRAPPPAIGGIIALAPPVEPAPSPTSAGPDVLQAPPPQNEPPPFSGSGSSEGGLVPERPVPPAESFVDPTLPPPVQDVVQGDIMNKQQQAADWTNTQ